MRVTPELYSVTISKTLWSQDTLEKLTNSINKYKKHSFLSFSEDLTWIENQTYYTILESDQYVLSKDNIIALALDDIEYKVKSTIDVSVDITQQLIELAERPVKLTTSGGDTYNNKCEVHMPGNLMATYNEMLLMSDSCTDELQTQLNAGWRLVAVCPQPDQRRPDYILGRFNPNFDADISAKRG